VRTTHLSCWRSGTQAGRKPGFVNIGCGASPGFKGNAKKQCYCGSMAAALDYLGSERGFSETLGDPDARMALGKLCCCEFKYRLTDDIQEIVRGLPPISG